MVAPVVAEAARFKKARRESGTKAETTLFGLTVVLAMVTQKAKGSEKERLRMMMMG